MYCKLFNKLLGVGNLKQINNNVISYTPKNSKYILNDLEYIKHFVLENNLKLNTIKNGNEIYLIHFGGSNHE